MYTISSFQTTDSGEEHPNHCNTKPLPMDNQQGTNDMKNILAELHLSHHIKSFEENDIKEENDILHLSIQDISELGITKIGERNRLKDWIESHTNIRAYPVNTPEPVIPVFTVEQEEKYKAIFNFLDKENSGRIMRFQLSSTLESLGQHQSESQLSDVFRTARLPDIINVSDFMELLRCSKESNGAYPGLDLIVDQPDFILNYLQKQDVLGKKSNPAQVLPSKNRDIDVSWNQKQQDVLRMSSTLAQVAAYKNRGDNAFRNQDYAQAVIEYSQALYLDPANWTILSNRSAAYLKEGNAKCAYQDARDCIDCNPTFIKGYSRLGAAQEELQQFENAMASYTKVLNMEPSNNIAQQGFQRCARQSHSKYAFIFELVDENGDGVIDFNEFTRALQSLSINVSTMEAMQIFREADRDCSGCLDFDEFADTMRRAASGDKSLAAIRVVSKQLQRTVEQLRRAPKNPQVNYSFMLNVDITPEAIKMVETCANGAYKLAPPADACEDQACTRTYNFLVVDENFIKIMAQTYCEEFLSNLKLELQQKGLSVNVDEVVEMNAVIFDSIRMFEIIAHRYSHMNGLSDSSSEGMALQLHSFRKAAILWASSESVDDVRVPLIQMGNVSTAPYQQPLSYGNGVTNEGNDSEDDDDRKEMWKNGAKMAGKVAFQILAAMI